ncbi:hypothetical protein Ptr902_10114 [Pyrenophora tritici-repentis]|uniref:Uncharacterized protein n=1 Tax=Pyrenophora tritici-repentis TaxID=45151 RepID=A0A5M9KSN4_9PLEO|nr:hypothetical protein PtrV1_12444 [Pyrenophora tritici-repentis]KAF7445248.1 hypothetical protein A1F99_102340 [Pyrenophora tritici-repentis]KAF7565512.1 hypothetical protein PtrM4_049460 [Pyrenophora tritici-repentis]KAI0584661.1 hypothetical protein Alg215_02898 [Pyrenophora tritici-repentis]KAI0590053.1 hypothetical protein Alg130_02608 [Pyrenophora tritici-repentis]
MRLSTLLPATLIGLTAAAATPVQDSKIPSRVRAENPLETFSFCCPGNDIKNMKKYSCVPPRIGANCSPCAIHNLPDCPPGS